jgi:hypothetical protein
MGRIIVEYNPNLSAIGVKTIEEVITPSMTSNDGSSNQYDIDMVAESLEENNLIDDLSLINQFREEGVHYIEF